MSPANSLAEQVMPLLSNTHCALGSLAEQGLLLEAEAKSQVMPLGVEEEVLPRHDRVVQDGVKPHSTPAMMYALRSWSSTTCA